MIAVLHFVRLLGTLLLVVAVYYRGSQLALFFVLLLMLAAQEAQAVALARQQRGMRDLLEAVTRPRGH